MCVWRYINEPCETATAPVSIVLSLQKQFPYQTASIFQSYNLLHMQIALKSKWELVVSDISKGLVNDYL